MKYNLVNFNQFFILFHFYFQLEEYSLVKFMPFSVNEEELISDVLTVVDDVLQWAEEQDVKVSDFDPPEENDN